MQQVFPHIAFRREVTVGHLLLDTDCECAVHAKVNPPIRPREDVEALWQAVLDRKIDWIVSDHACCSAEQKWSKDDPDQHLAGQIGIWRHRISALRRAERRQQARDVLQSHGRAFELEAGAALRAARARATSLQAMTPTSRSSIRMRASWCAPPNLESEQGYSPFEGIELRGRVKSTFLRGDLVFDNGNVVGPAKGQYLPQTHNEVTGWTRLPRQWHGRRRYRMFRRPRRQRRWWLHCWFDGRRRRHMAAVEQRLRGICAGAGVLCRACSSA